MWLQTLHDWLAAQHTPDDPLVVLGDFNVAPEDRDVWDPKKFVGATHVTPAERDAVVQLEKWGMEDLFRRVYPDADRLYSYWDYRAGDFHQHRGMRIDLVLGDARRSPSASRGRSSIATPARAPAPPTTRP